MELKILNLEKAEKGKKKLPDQFREPVRGDIIKRAFLALASTRIQAFGNDPRAGKKASAKLSRRRRDYKGSYGLGISRAPRKIMSRRGTRFNWVGAFAAGTVGGKEAHPPKIEKVLIKKINKKERRKAIRSALAATVDKKIVEKRGHIVPESYPFIIEDKIESISKTKELINALRRLGFEKELERASVKTIRAGKGKRRGRKYKRRNSLLIVVSDKCSLEKSANSIPGVETAQINHLNVGLLAPGAVPGRATIFTESAIEKLKNKNLFMNK